MKPERIRFDENVAEQMRIRRISEEEVRQAIGRSVMQGTRPFFNGMGETDGGYMLLFSLTYETDELACVTSVHRRS